MKTGFKGKAVILIMVLALSLTGCTLGESGKYKYYIEGIISANYLGISDEYAKATSADKSAGDVLYLQNVMRLADNINAYYGFNINSDHELYSKLLDLSKKIYSKAKYEVGDAHREGVNYYVDLTIYPIDILNQSAPEVEAYINDFNGRVQNGEYNDYTQDAYESEFASGILDILLNACDYMEYKEPVKLSIEILSNEDSYYISDDDLREIDANIIATSADGYSAVTATESDTSE